MAKCNRDDLSKYRTQIIRDYLEELARVDGMAKVNFRVTQECSCCGETGYVPEHHKYLCVFCWCTTALFTDANSLQAFGNSDHATRESEGRGVDKVKTNIPIGIEGVCHDETPSDILIYTAKNFSQEELQALIP